MIFRRVPLPLVAIGLAVVGLSVPAGAVHLFPLAPGDPFGDCGTGLSPDPGGSAGHVGIGPLSFTDDASGSNTTGVDAGDAVTFRWDNPYCHSVTFQTEGVGGTEGGPPAGFSGEEPQLIKPDGDNKTFTVSFPAAGTYEYVCVHHASVGMTGQVVVY